MVVTPQLFLQKIALRYLLATHLPRNNQISKFEIKKSFRISLNFTI